MSKSPENICNTSVQDAQSSLHHITDLKMLKKAVRYEMQHGDRTSMIRILKSKIRQLEKGQRP